MKTTNGSRNVSSTRAFNSFEEWHATFLPNRNNSESNELDSAESPSELGKMMATATLQRFSSLSKDRKKQPKN